MKKIFLSLVGLSILFQVHAVTVLPPKYNIGTQIGQSLGQGIQQQYQLQKQQKSLDEGYQRILQKLSQEKDQVEEAWFLEFTRDVYQLNPMQRMNQIMPIVGLCSFSGEHPVVQTLGAVSILYGNIHSEYKKIGFKCPQDNQHSNPEQFAISLLKDAAINKKYIPAKKWLVNFYQDRGEHAQKLYWLHSAAEDGAADVMRVLAGHYIIGIGIHQDMAEYIKWMALAEARGDGQATQIMQFMKNDPRFQQCPEFIEGLKLAKNWQRSHISLFIHP